MRRFYANIDFRMLSAECHVRFESQLETIDDMPTDRDCKPKIYQHHEVEARHVWCFSVPGRGWTRSGYLGKDKEGDARGGKSHEMWRGRR
jgi:hypothetical protein